MTNEEYKKELTRYWDSIRDKGSSMKEKPILFNAEMVKAILEGRKTATRRVIKPQPKSLLCYAFAGSRGMAGTWGYPGDDAWKSWGEEYKLPKDLSEADKNQRFTPPCHTGDILYVRETWRVKSSWSGSYEGCEIEYKAGGSKVLDKVIKLPGKNWNPSLHMPKEAARIWLKVTDVRVERLQDMNVEDCKAEGIYDDYSTLSKEYHDLLIQKAYPKTFKKLWDSTISKPDLAKYGWDANPWVWVISFERIEKGDSDED